MALRITRPGKPPLVLTADEQALVSEVAAALRRLRSRFSIESMVGAMNVLNPDSVEEILQQVTIVFAQAAFAGQLGSTFRRTVDAEFNRILDNTPGLSTMSVTQQGVRLPSGIIVPRDLVDQAGVKYEVVLNPQDVITNYINPKVIQYAQTRSAALVTGINDANRLALRRILSDSMAQGLSPRETAKIVQRSIGLHTRWARAVNNFEQSTVQQLTRQGLTPAQALRRAQPQVTRYRNLLIRKRAAMIARTEIQMAQNMARQSAWRMAADAGILEPDTQKEWLVAPAESKLGVACPVCLELAGERVQWNAAFHTGHLVPPAHPHCRCTVVLVPPSRGLTGLPSQDMGSWLARLDAMTEAVPDADLV